MPWNVIESGLTQFRQLGTKAIELTGGGDPTLYPRINDLMELLKDFDFHIGINTNAVDSQLIEHWEYCDWVRVSMNTFDYYDTVNIGPIKDKGAQISACYIWNSLSDVKTFKKVAAFCKEEKIVCRVAPDCIQTLNGIDDLVNNLRNLITRMGEDAEYMFLSDFNITTKRHNEKCLIHMIKPCFYTDGYVYPCPSSELAFENRSQMQPKFALCNWDGIYDFYTGPGATLATDRPCSYCKYEKQQIVLEEVLTETTFNEFA
jgi:organic radical activating enzyme